jgi:chaperonin cofactor prefoldin
MARQLSQTDQVRMLCEAITHEKAKLEECLDNIRDYAEKLRALTDDAQQRLIGRSS